MATPFKLSVVAPDRTVFEDQVQSLIVPAYKGYMGVLANHEPQIVALNAGVMEYMDANNQRSYVSIGGGFLEIIEEGAIVLASSAEKSDEVDLAEAQKALEEARKALRGEESVYSAEEATEELERAMARIQVAEKK